MAADDIAGISSKPDSSREWAELNRVSLRLMLEREDVDPDSYSLEGGHQDERYVLEQASQGWAVYYAERGMRTSEEVFATEACNRLFDLLLRDPNTRRK